jgi:hypothetical protein
VCCIRYICISVVMNSHTPLHHLLTKKKRSDNVESRGKGGHSLQPAAGQEVMYCLSSKRLSIQKERSFRTGEEIELETYL